MGERVATKHGTPTHAERFGDTGAVTLRQWLRVFFAYPGPRIIVGVLGLAVVARLLAGGPRWADVVVAVVLVLAQPFTEWNIHVGVLHFRPRQLAGLRIDPFVARKHRAHHRDPEHIVLTLVPLPALLGLIVIFGAGVGLVFRDWRLGLTGATTGYALLLVYEWTHFLIHSPHVPRTAIYRAIWRSHRLHHFKNEHYWFGITSPVGDKVLRTAPDRRSVPTSPTARTLGFHVDAPS